MGTIRVARLLGIDVRVHWSWFGVVGLLTWWLATGFFSEVYDDWSTRDAWIAAIASTFLFFLSILLHEFSHSLMAKRYKLPVDSITLFIFGGVSNLKEEPSTARQEFIVAIVGPLTSFVIGIVLVGVSIAGNLGGAEDSIPIAVCEYLAFINIAVGIFNMLPGFPLDGGRVLRSALWARSDNMLKATRWASTTGTFISFGLMAVGVVSILLGSFIGGAWFIVIGWFLRNASDQSYQQLLLRKTLEGTTVSEVVNRSYEAAPPDIMLNDLVTRYMFGFSQRCVPVVVAGDLLGDHRDERPQAVPARHVVRHERLQGHDPAREAHRRRARRRPDGGAATDGRPRLPPAPRNRPPRLHRLRHARRHRPPHPDPLGARLEPPRAAGLPGRGGLSNEQ